MCDPMAQFCALPGRVILDTCIINLLQDQGEYIWDGVDPEGASKYGIDPDLMALRAILQVNQRAMFQFVISPLTLAEVANTQDLPERERRVRWVLDILDHWLVMLDDIEDRTSQGGTVRSRFKLSPYLQRFEQQLMQIPDFRRDPMDRLLLVQYRMANCDAFVTVDTGTIWRHREELHKLGIRVLKPKELWSILEPWARIWM